MSPHQESRPTWREPSHISRKNKSTKKIQRWSASYSVCASSTPQLLKERDSVHWDGTCLIHSTWVTWETATWFWTDTWNLHLALRKFHLKILSTFSVKSCTVGILLMIGIEDWPNHTSKISWKPESLNKLNCSRILKAKTSHSEFHFPPTMRSILNTLKLWAPKHHSPMVFIQTHRSVSVLLNVRRSSTHCYKSLQRTHLQAVKVARQHKTYSNTW